MLARRAALLERALSKCVCFTSHLIVFAHFDGEARPPQENEVAEAGHQPALIWSHRRCMAQFRIARAIRQFADVRLLTRIAFGPVAALIWRPFLLSIGASHPCGSRI